MIISTITSVHIYSGGADAPLTEMWKGFLKKVLVILTWLGGFVATLAAPRLAANIVGNAYVGLAKELARHV